MKNNQYTLNSDEFKTESFDTLTGKRKNHVNIIMAPITDLYSFHNHPYKIVDDEKMEELIESIRLHGILTPIIVRTKINGGYEIISGHRRKHAAERIGMSELPVIIKNCTDDDATIFMVNSNIQRDEILPSEKAKAYCMKYNALKHQGKKSGSNTLDLVGEEAGDNAKKVQRYIWLSRLSNELLDMIDNKKLGFTQGVDISFLTEHEQQWVQVIIEETGCNITTVQSSKLKELSKSKELTLSIIRLILTEEISKKRNVTIRANKINKYFENNYSNEEIEKIIIQLLDEWKNRQQKGDAK